MDNRAGNLWSNLWGWGPCVGVRRAMALIGNAKQATSEGKSGPVETGLTGPATTGHTVVVTDETFSTTNAVYCKG